VNDADAPKYDPGIFQLNLPILGICYGLQLINKHFGGTVERKNIREDGQFRIKVDPSCEIFDGLGESQDVLLTHGDSVEKLASCCQVTAQSGGLVAAIAHKEKRVFGVQFHPEVDLTENGERMMHNFLYKVSPAAVLLKYSCTFHKFHIRYSIALVCVHPSLAPPPPLDHPPSLQGIALPRPLHSQQQGRSVYGVYKEDCWRFQSVGG